MSAASRLICARAGILGHVASEYLLLTSSDIFFDPNCSEYRDHAHNTTEAEGVVEHSSRLQVTCNHHLQPLCSAAALVSMYNPKGSGKPYAVDPASSRVLAPRSGLEPEISGSTVQSSNYYTIAAHKP